MKSESESCSVVSDSLQPHGLCSPWNSPGQNTGVGSLSLLQGIIPTQGSNTGLSHCSQILYQLSYKDLESLFGGSRRGAQLLVYPWPKTGPPLSGVVVLFDRARSFGRDTHGAVREEGDTCLASQISQINPGDQWGDRCRNQIALTSAEPQGKPKNTGVGSLLQCMFPTQELNRSLLHCRQILQLSYQGSLYQGMYISG